MKRRRTVVPEKTIATFTKNGWVVQLRLRQHEAGMMPFYEVGTWKDLFFRARTEVTSDPEEAKRAFAAARHYVVVAIARQALGLPDRQATGN